MKKLFKEKKRTFIAGLMGMFIVTAGIAVLVNASRLNKVFNPQDFERFENDISIGNEYDFVAGDGKASDLADDGDDGEARSDKDGQNATRVDDERYGGSDERGNMNPNNLMPNDLSDSQNLNPLNLSLNNKSDTSQVNPNAIGISGTDEVNGIGLNFVPNNSTSAESAVSDSKTDTVAETEVIEGDSDNGYNEDNNKSGRESERGNGKTGNSGEGNSASNDNNSENNSGSESGGNSGGGSGGGSNGGSNSGNNNGNNNNNNGGNSNGDNNEDNNNKPTDWENDQMKPGDSIVTDDGKLISLKVSTPKDWTFYLGESYKSEGVTVTAEFLSDGKAFSKEISYGHDGYSVNMSTKNIGIFAAVFDYKGMTTSAEYRVLSNYVTLYYGGYLNGTYYSAVYPGTPAESILGNLGEISPRVYPTSGAAADLTEDYGRMIAYLGDSRLQNTFRNTLSGNYYVTVFPEEDSSGFLTTMLTGFRYVLGNNLQDNKSYVYYPMNNWAENQSRNLISFVEKVPEGCKIKREIKNEGFYNYTGDQVLVEYTGINSNFEVPMGVTSIKIQSLNKSVVSINIPESVKEIDYISLQRNFPNLSMYSAYETGVYKVIDGVLYSKDGKTLLSVPSGKTEIREWSKDIIEIGDGAFNGSAIKTLNIPNTVIKLGKDCFKDSFINEIYFSGESIPVGVSGIGYNGKVLVQDSAYDTICKNWVIALSNNDIIVGVRDEQGNEIEEKAGLYQYADGNIAVYSDNTSTLAGVSPYISGKYSVPSGITAIGSGAFVSAEGVYEIEIPKEVTELKRECFVDLNEIESIILKGDSVIISENLFGERTDGENIPNIKIYVPEKCYNEYMVDWKNKLDPVYGEGTAEKLLVRGEDNLIYSGNAKYRITNENGERQYSLIKVYDDECTSFEVMDKTTEIEKGAFSYCDKLEIVYLPKTVKKINNEAFTGCNNLETVIVNTKNVSGVLAGEANVYYPDDILSDFLYENGIVYGISSDGVYTLLNVPTDIEEFILRPNTVYLADKACEDCDELTSIEFKDNKLKKIGESCFKNCSSIESLSFNDESKLEEIGDYGFFGCINLREIKALSVKKVGKGAFYDCVNLVSAEFPSILEISEECFYNCKSLKFKERSINVGTAIGDRAFAYCTSMSDIVDMSGVTRIGAQAFIGCSSLKSVILPDTLKHMDEECFRDCVMLKTVDINGELTTISRYCFYGCRNLTDIVFGDRIRKTLKFVGVKAFAKCYSLEVVDFSELSVLSQMGEKTFGECESLTTVKFPESLIKIPNRCFEECSNLSVLTLLSKEPTELGEFVFGDEVSAFIHLWVQDDILSDYISAYTPILDEEYGDGTTAAILGVIDDDKEIIQGVTYIKNEDGSWVLTDVSPDFSGDFKVPKTTVKIADEAFKNCKGLTGIEISQDSEVILGNRCFVGCDNLKTVYLYGDIPQWGDECFMDCEGLETVIIGSSSKSIVPRIGTRAFKNCIGLKGTSAVTIRSQVNCLGEECFADCVNLVGIPINTIIYNSLEKVEDRAFANCAALTNAFISNKYTILKSIGEYAYYNCDSLKQPSIPDSVTEIGEGCFSECDNLMYVSVYGAVEEYPKDCFKNCPKLIRTGGTAKAFSSLKRIGQNAYEGCKSLAVSANWHPGKYENLEEIGENAFKDCSSLTDIYLSETVLKVGQGAFNGCTGITALEFRSAVPPEIGIIDLNTMATNFSIKVPDSGDSGDIIYLAYLDKLTELLGRENALKILNSVSDGAGDRFILSDGEFNLNNIQKIPNEGSLMEDEKQGVNENPKEPEKDKESEDMEEPKEPEKDKESEDMEEPKEPLETEDSEENSTDDEELGFDDLSEINSTENGEGAEI